MGYELLDKLQTGDAVDSVDIAHSHDLYDIYSPIWRKCRDCVEGEEVIKQKGEAYLPKLNGQSAKEYEVYKDRAQYFNGTGRTVEAYLGMIFRKLPTYNFAHDGVASNELNDFMKQHFLDSVTHDGLDFDTFIHTVLEEIVTVNRVGVLVDMPDIAKETGLIKQYTISDYEELDIHPLVSMYTAENILNWHTEIVNGQVLPVFFVLSEFKDGLMTGSLKHEIVDAYRILYLENFSNPKTRRYKVIEVEKRPNGPNKGGLVVTSVSYPKVDGKHLNHIPFYVMTDRGLDYKRIHDPMIHDLANVNIGYYRNSADHENELHWTGVKSVVFPDWDVKTFGQPKVGGALAAPKDCIPVLLEPSADSALNNAMRDKMEQMSILGAERISQKGRYLPSAETARITASTESSVLSNMITYISLNMTKILQAMIGWAKPTLTDWTGVLTATVEINSDLADDIITGADAKNWMDVLLNGGVSYDTYYSNMEKRETYPDNWTKEKEWEALKKTRRLLMDVDLVEDPQDVNRETEEIQGTQTASKGTGADVTVRPIGDKPRVRTS